MEKCAECDRMGDYCHRCQVYFCNEHILSHRDTFICPNCQQEKCIDQLGVEFNSNQCFLCAAKCYKKIKQEYV